MNLKVDVHTVDVLKHVLDYPRNYTLHPWFIENTLRRRGGGGEKKKKRERVRERVRERERNKEQEGE